MPGLPCHLFQLFSLGRIRNALALSLDLLCHLEVLIDGPFNFIEPLRRHYLLSVDEDNVLQTQPSRHPLGAGALRGRLRGSARSVLIRRTRAWGLCTAHKARRRGRRRHRSAPCHAAFLGVIAARLGQGGRVGWVHLGPRLSLGAPQADTERQSHAPWSGSRARLPAPHRAPLHHAYATVPSRSPSGQLLRPHAPENPSGSPGRALCLNRQHRLRRTPGPALWQRHRHSRGHQRRRAL
mmetsp:Transcript_8328/g.30717  ORF Transcript_8328/g.30717 Transcript_8328/m.30717 type:complete len:238 (-) Transcript_8328:30-743(-)